MHDRLVSSHRHDWSARPAYGAGGLAVHRTDFGVLYGLGGYEWVPYVADRPGLVWVIEGVMTVHMADRRWLLTPQHAAWLPAGALGDVVANVPTRAMYVECDPIGSRGGHGLEQGPRASRVSVDLHAAELLLLLAETTDDGFARRLWSSLVPRLRPVADVGLRLPMPTDPRARQLALRVLDVAGDPRGGGHRTLVEWGEEVHVSAKTLQRLWGRETGGSFAQWRTQARLNASLPHLASGGRVQDVAEAVGYRSAVGYIDAFKGHFGVTPGGFFTRTGAGSALPASALRTAAAGAPRRGR